MRMMLVLVWLGLSSCRLPAASDLVECDMNLDCQRADGGPVRTCTLDRLCVLGTAAERLCTETYPAAQNAPARPIPIGALLHISTLTANEAGRKQVLMLAADEINARLEGGRGLVLHFCDVSQDPQPPNSYLVNAKKAVDVLLRERHVVALVGPTFSSEVTALADQVSAAQVPLVSPSATLTTLSQRQGEGYIFRTVPKDGDQAAKLARLVPGDAGLTAIYVDDGHFGSDYYNDFLAAWMHQPMLVLHFAPKGDVSMAVNGALLSGAANVLAVANNGDDAAALVKRLAAKVPTDGGARSPVGIFMNGDARRDSLLTLAKDTSLQLDLTRVSGIAPGVDQASPVLAALKSKLPGVLTNVYHSYTYDALYAVGVAAGSIAEEPSGPRVAEALHRIVLGGTAINETDYLPAIQALGSGLKVTLRGATGWIGFRENGDRDGASFEQWSIDTATDTFKSTPVP